ncbi:helix-turn-helix domain-containing protein [Streptacidiphilus jiangxiensis]|uniref:helix-turn-helix domain-containing protein n=1 Tax=Streptacidiphilus jiangxiensis TaxID=235985 RepID=UPI000693A22E|nr:helix-turn-helix domain-containing protein [Streptacidiphilus jiangxiensis]
MAVRLVVRLRRMKDDSGLSLAQLAERTGYSASSWERYLGGRTLPPGEAVEALAALVGADVVPLLVLHETARGAWREPVAQPHARAATPTVAQIPADIADAADIKNAANAANTADPADTSGTPGSGDAAGAEGVVEEGDGEGVQRSGAADVPESAADAPPPAPPVARSARTWLPAPRTVLVSVVSALVGAVVALAVAPTSASTPAQPSAQASAQAAGARIPAVTASPVHYTCHYTRTDGRWYAGNSATSSDTVIDGMDGPDVAEVQCLLQRVGISPGGVDGSFGPMTLRALLAEQQDRHLSIDGQVGPQTWAALRG